MEDLRPDPVLGERVVRAMDYAVELHAEQARKATRTPYLAHLLAVCSLVLEDGGTEDEAIAALLHDGPEDQGGQSVLDEIERHFGPPVARLVLALSDTLEDPKPPWRKRQGGLPATPARRAGIGPAHLAGGQAPQPAHDRHRRRRRLAPIQRRQAGAGLVLPLTARRVRGAAARFAQPSCLSPAGRGGLRHEPLGSHLGSGFWDMSSDAR